MIAGFWSGSTLHTMGQRGGAQTEVTDRYRAARVCSLGGRAPRGGKPRERVGSGLHRKAHMGGCEQSREGALRGCEPSDSGDTRQTTAGAPISQTGRTSPRPLKVQRPGQSHLTSRATPTPEWGPVYTQLTKKHTLLCIKQRASGDLLYEDGRPKPALWQPRGVGLGGACEGGLAVGLGGACIPVADSHGCTAETNTPL